jgi:hypothetical protein
MTDPANNGNGSISASKRSELLERILSSTELRRAARLRDFLNYVGQRALEDEHVQISECEIGVRVFGRPENYDTSIDNIVRVNASELRKRIASYYENEGVHEAILLEIPRRNYTPQFHRRPAGTAPNHSRQPKQPVEETPSAVPETVSVPAPVGPLGTLALAALVLALAGGCIHFWLENRDLQRQIYAWRTQPALSSFWSGILESPRQTDLVVADTSVSMIEDILKTRISLSDYLNRNYEQQIQESNLGDDLRDSLRVIASRRNVSLGDVRVAQKILAFDPLSRLNHLQFARDYRISSIKSDNVILIGSSRSNPWSMLFEDRMNFIVDYDPGLNEMLVRNRHPQPGERATYISPVDPNGTAGYSVVDYVPNHDRTAEVLIFAGTTSEATEAAADFLTSESALEGFGERLGVRRLPYFEVLLKTTKLAGTPLSAEVIAYRALSDPPLRAQ